MRPYATPNPTLRERVKAMVDRAGLDGIETTSVRLAYGEKGVNALNRLAREKAIDRVRPGLYRRRVTTTREAT